MTTQKPMTPAQVANAHQARLIREAIAKGIRITKGKK